MPNAATEKYMINLLYMECPKSCGSRANVCPVSLVPPCFSGPNFFLRGYFVGPKFFLVGSWWVQYIFLWVIHWSEIFSRGYFVSPKFFLWLFRQPKIFSRGYFVGPQIFSWVFVGRIFFHMGISWVKNFMTFNKLQ